MQSQMEAHHEKILQVQKEAWNKSSAGWKKWDGMMMDFLKPVGEEMITLLQLKPHYTILDVATGTGEPGLTIASMLNTGKVTGTDLAEEMLTVAREHAVNRGLENFKTVCCDSAELPFEDNTFDGISCRFSFMFFPDMQLALKEMVRVLKPGRKIVASYWNEAGDNPWVCNSMDVMIRLLKLNPPSPGSPGLFRCAQPGMMAELFLSSGLSKIEEREVRGKLSCGTVETYWNFITEVASPLAFSKADAKLQSLIKDEAVSKLLRKYNEGNIEIDSSATVLCGEKTWK